MTTWTLLTLVAVAAACTFAAIAWRQHREARRRSDARVAALAAAIDGPLEAFTSERPVRNGWMIAAGAVPILLVVAALLVTRGPRPAPAPPVSRQPDALELLDMHHDRSGDLLTVTGTVRVRGRDTAPVTAVVTGRDAAGRIVASAHAPLDDAALDLERRVVVPGVGVRPRRPPLPGQVRNAAWTAYARRPARGAHGGTSHTMTSPHSHSTVRSPLRALLLPVLLAAALGGLAAHAQDGFRFKSGVDLINVTATVTDEDGRFVPSLTKDDFAIFENGRRQEISHFSRDRAPVSLGILLDTSGSMTADKMAAARSAIDRFIYDLLGRDDELFFMEFASTARVTQAWTTDRAAISRAVGRVDPVGGTAIYDAVAKAIPMAAAGRHKKKALLVISDGNDTSSTISVPLLRQQIRDSEVLVYALGVDGAVRTESSRRTQPPIGLPIPNPFPPGRGDRFSSRRSPAAAGAAAPGRARPASASTPRRCAR